MFRHSDGEYYLKSNFGITLVGADESVIRITRFLAVLYQRILQNYASRPRQTVTYEDLYYVASQIYEDEVGNFGNPIVATFIKDIADEVDFLTGGARPGYIGRTPVLTLAREVCTYIEGVIRERLSVAPSKLPHLALLGDAVEDTDIERVDVFTLNHDTLIEQYLRQINKQYVDGFEPRHSRHSLRSVSG